MKLAIMQPYLFPYIGYFQLMNAADEFVVYDNIKYTKKGWINRNRILVNGSDAYINFPLKKDSDYLDVKDRSGKVVNWGVETNSPGILTRAGWTRRSLKAGDEVTLILCPAKNGQPVAYIGSGDPGTKVIFADGRELDFTDKTIDKSAP